VVAGIALDDCLYALHETIPRLTRSSSHRLLQRHAIYLSAQWKGSIGTPDGVEHDGRNGFVLSDVGAGRILQVAADGEVRMLVVSSSCRTWD
jgi:hypothetical protein